MEWLRDLGFGGVMVWAADLDDFRGSCGTGPFPLLHAMLEALDGYRVAFTYDGGAAFTPGKKADRECVTDGRTHGRRGRAAASVEGERDISAGGERDISVGVQREEWELAKRLV